MTDAVHDQLSPTEPQENPAAPKDPKELFTQDQLAEHARGMAAEGMLPFAGRMDAHSPREGVVGATSGSKPGTNQPTRTPPTEI